MHAINCCPTIHPILSSSSLYVFAPWIVHRAVYLGLCAATASWCVAKQGVGDDQLKQALDYACGHGADMPSHASYAFNSYYQRNGRASVACDFSGAGVVVYQQPSEFDDGDLR
jgi:hypothetical protein